jgi:hypothetical protein
MVGICRSTIVTDPFGEVRNKAGSRAVGCAPEALTGAAISTHHIDLVVGGRKEE